MTRTAAPSPNFNDRTLPVTMLVLHYTGMQTGAAALARLRNPTARVSSHYLIAQDGQVFSLVDEKKRAWHAGSGYWRGITDINSASIGIEIVNGGHEFGLPAFPPAQIDAVIALGLDIVQRHTIAPHNIIGHSDLAPNRKQDPGERFPWQTLAEAGLGLWPEPPDTPPEAVDLRASLLRVGYNVDNAPDDMHAILSAFQRRYLPGDITGQPCAQTRALAHALARLTPVP